jgi:Tfp pilus assembly protein PilX
VNCGQYKNTASDDSAQEYLRQHTENHSPSSIYSSSHIHHPTFEQPKMNKNHHNNQTLIQFILRAQQLARHDARSDRGYAMLITSIISVVLLSMLAAYMTMTNLSKSSTNAYVDGTNTFYAAESGLNKRAQQFRERFTDYINPSGTVPTSVGATAVTAANISNCFSISVNAAISATNDFECRNYPFKYNNNIATVNGSGGGAVLSEQDNNRNTSNYIAHTFVAPKQNYATTPPSVMTIPAGEVYAGLKALEYQYTVYATATKRNETGAIAPSFTEEQKEAKNRVVKEAGDAALILLYDAEQARVDALNNTSAARNSGSNSVLQMDFKNRIVPLFQFAAFYDGDMEMSSSSNMTLSGWVHTNANLYVSPYTTSNGISTTFFSNVTAAGDIYNRIDAYPAIAYAGITRVLMTGNDCSVSTNCKKFPDYNASNQNPLTTTQINEFSGKVRDRTAGTVVLKAPQPGFLRKRNYFDNNVGEYYAKADMRLEMVPDRDVTSTGTAPWSRNQGIIPFNFTAIGTGGTGTCTTTLPSQPAVSATAPRVAIARDPDSNYIDPDRKNAASLRCNVFTKGQLQSLRQPVLVLTDLHQTTDVTLKTATGATPADGSEAKILGRPTSLTALTGLSTTVTGSDTTKNIILRALQVALASTPSPVLLDTLSKPFNDAVYATGTPGGVFKAEFTRLLNTVPAATLPVADLNILLANATTPNQIAALQNAWFLPAPVQRIESTTPQDTAVRNTRSSGFYDGREQRWITMLQTNIASLSVWNRDGLYVNASTPTGTAITDIDATLTTAYVSNDAMKNAAFNSGTYATIDTASTDGLAFTRAATIPTTTTAKGLQTLGLGSLDETEGGLVFHATVSDDLNGNNTIANADDVSLDTTNPILKKNPDGTNVLNGTATITIDYPRKYRNGNIKQSPFGFAFNGANYLPGALTLVTDQSIYVQGDFNNNGATKPNFAANTPSDNRLPASIIGDTITTLSNQCLSNNSVQSTTNHLGVPAAQLKCGLPRSTTGSIDITVGGNTATYYPMTASSAFNAAFLSYTDRSIGNLGTGRGFGATVKVDSGSINNYMRMLENWGRTSGWFFNYSGSLVSLGTPLEVSGSYKDGGTYYDIPQRNFNFDRKFNDFSNLPPLSPRAIFLQQEVFKRKYN